MTKTTNHLLTPKCCLSLLFTDMVHVWLARLACLDQVYCNLVQVRDVRQWLIKVKFEVKLKHKSKVGVDRQVRCRGWTPTFSYFEIWLFCPFSTELKQFALFQTIALISQHQIWPQSIPGRWVFLMPPFTVFPSADWLIRCFAEVPCRSSHILFMWHNLYII